MVASYSNALSLSSLMQSQGASIQHTECRVVRRLGCRKDAPNHSLGEDESRVIVMDIDLLKTCFHLPLHSAAKELGVCSTALKRVCRKIGLRNWPFRKIKALDRKASENCSEVNLRKKSMPKNGEHCDVHSYVDIEAQQGLTTKHLVGKDFHRKQIPNQESPRTVSTDEDYWAHIGMDDFSNPNPEEIGPIFSHSNSPFFTFGGHMQRSITFPFDIEPQSASIASTDNHIPSMNTSSSFCPADWHDSSLHGRPHLSAQWGDPNSSAIQYESCVDAATREDRAAPEDLGHRNWAGRTAVVSAAGKPVDDSAGQSSWTWTIPPAVITTAVPGDPRGIEALASLDPFHDDWAHW